jgi:hypothetical protein
MGRNVDGSRRPRWRFAVRPKWANIGSGCMAVAVRTAGKDDIAAVLDMCAVGGENASRPVDSSEALEALIAMDPRDSDPGRGRRHSRRFDDRWIGRMALSPLPPCCGPRQPSQGRGNATPRPGRQRLVELRASRIDAVTLDGNELGQSVWATRNYHRQAEGLDRPSRLRRGGSSQHY